MPLVHWETKTPCRRSRFVIHNFGKQRSSFCALEGRVQFREPPSNHYIWSCICLTVNTHCFVSMSTLLWSHVTLLASSGKAGRRGCRILGFVNFRWVLRVGTPGCLPLHPKSPLPPSTKNCSHLYHLHLLPDYLTTFFFFTISGISSLPLPSVYSENLE